MNIGRKAIPPRVRDVGTTGRPEAHPPRLCDLCRAPVIEHHCKVVCFNCGYQRDCSDP